MKIQKLEEQIAFRADDIVQKKIRDFKMSTYNAIGKLLGLNVQVGPGGGLHNIAKANREAVVQVLRVLASEDNKSGWPKEIWENERQRLTTEIMSRMDEVQKTLMAVPPPASDEHNKPAPEKKDE